MTENDPLAGMTQAEYARAQHDALYPAAELTVEHISETNASRCRLWHGSFPSHDDPWTGADWSNAMQGEAGEAGNVVKKLRRHELGTSGNIKADDTDVEKLRQKLLREIGDTYLYLDLLATYYGIRLVDAARTSFNEKSVEMGLPHRL